MIPPGTPLQGYSAGLQPGSLQTAYWGLHMHFNGLLGISFNTELQGSGFAIEVAVAQTN